MDKEQRRRLSNQISRLTQAIRRAHANIARARAKGVDEELIEDMIEQRWELEARRDELRAELLGDYNYD